MDLIEITGIPAITIIIYWIINLIKSLTNNNEKFLKYIPLITGGLGIIFGIIIFYAFPEMMSASNVLCAIVIGLCSGLAATGTNQIFKQLTKTPNKKIPLSDQNNDKKNDIK